MRMLFVTYGTRPHYFPMVPLAWSCHAAGHEVRVAGPPALAEPLKESGLLGVCVGADADISAFLSGGAFRPKKPRPDETVEENLERFVAGIAPIASLRCEAMIDELLRFCRNWHPDIIVYDPATFAGAVAAQVLGIPAVCNLYGMVRQFRIEMDGINGVEPSPDYANQFKRFGVEPLVEPAAWIDPCPPGLRWRPPSPPANLSPEVPRYSMQYVRYNGSGLVPEWLIEPPARPRVAITWGTTQEKKLGEEVVRTGRRIVSAVASLDVEVVLTIGTTSREHLVHLDSLPDNVRTVHWIPFHVLAETCGAIVHTGGTGMMLTAAACGVPQLGISTIPESIFNTDQLEDYGAGIHIREPEMTEEQVTRAVRRLLNDESHRAAARRLREEMEAQLPPSGMVGELERIATSAREGTGR
jgi:UDP:flavonoid glycosyltransferase YjiC (YdhE family)